MKKPSVPKSAGGSQNPSRNSTSSLAVFYVEQVALNRHVSPQQAATPLMTGWQSVVNSISEWHGSLTTKFQFRASN
jgi:hypothetical protein